MKATSKTWNLESFLQETQDHPLFAEELGMSRGGNPNSKLVLVLGPNGSGKSLLRKWVTQTGQEADILVMHLSMAGRKRYMSTLVYGDESDESTGRLSSRLVVNGLRNCRTRADTPHVLFLDEPDIGASDELCAGMGRYLATQLQSEPLPASTLALFLVTHSTYLVRELLPLQPQILFFGASFPDLEAWLDRKVEPLDLEAFDEACKERWTRVQNFFKPLS